MINKAPEYVSIAKNGTLGYLLNNSIIHNSFSLINSLAKIVKKHGLKKLSATFNTLLTTANNLRKNGGEK